MADVRKRIGSKGTTWQLRFNDPNSGKQRYKTFTRRKEADDFLGKLSTSDYVHDSETASLAEAADRWLTVCETIGRKGREPVEALTLKPYKLHAKILKGLRGATKLNTLTPLWCDQLRDELLTLYTRKYAKKILVSFKAILSQARSDGKMKHDPAENTAITISKRQRMADHRLDIPSVEDARLLLATAASLRDHKNEQVSQAWQRYYPFFVVAIYSGMRPGEVLGLPWCNVDFDRSEIKVDQDADIVGNIGKPKSAAAYRTIHMPASAMRALKAWKAQCPKGELGLVFPNWQGDVESHTNLTNRGWYVLLEKSGFKEKKKPPRYPLKSLRHVRASLEIHNGASAKELTDLMGHASVQITFDVYGHLFKDHAAARAKRATVIEKQLSGAAA